MSVLDASALLALIHDEPGGEVVAAHLTGGILGTANRAEVVGRDGGQARRSGPGKRQCAQTTLTSPNLLVPYVSLASVLS